MGIAKKLYKNVNTEIWSTLISKMEISVLKIAITAIKGGNRIIFLLDIL